MPQTPTAYDLGRSAALRALGFEKAAISMHEGMVPHPPAGIATVAEEAAPSLLNRLGNSKIKLKTLGGLGLLAGGAMLAHNTLNSPQVEVHPTLPMRTMYA